jgi:hypothetical protein
MVRWPATGKYRRTRLFVFTLGHSRKAVRLLTWQSSTQIWCALHEHAFRRLGGTTKVVVLDNLKEGVLTPDIYDPTLNPPYRDVLAHYGVVALPCRVGDPDRKGKVESGIGHTQKTPLHGLRFESLEAAQAYLDRWERHWADTRIHGTTKRQVAAMFAHVCGGAAGRPDVNAVMLIEDDYGPSRRIRIEPNRSRIIGSGLEPPVSLPGGADRLVPRVPLKLPDSQSGLAVCTARPIRPPFDC